MKTKKVLYYFLYFIIIAGVAFVFESSYNKTYEKDKELLTLSKANLSMNMGEKSQIKIISAPKDVSKDDLVWKSSDENVAIVNNNGEVIAKKNGTANITVEDSKGNKVGESKVEIKKVEIVIPVTSISASIANKEMDAGELYDIGISVLPENATNKNVIWSSSNNYVATVDSNGVVSAKSVGVSIITARTTDDSNKVVSVKISVLQPTPQVVYINKVELDKSTVDMSPNSQVQLNANVLPISASNKTLVWSSDDISVATVNQNGLISAISAGKTIITAESADGSNANTSVLVTVTNPIITVTNIDLNVYSFELSLGETYQLTATVTPSNATNKSVTWTSSNTSVATVSSTGLITAKSSGTSTITAKTSDGSGIIKTTMVTVKTPTIPTVKVTGISLNTTTKELNIGETYQLTATVTPSNATNKSVTWTSSNTSVATVSSTGLITAKTAGIVTITVTTIDGSIKATLNLKVFVVYDPLNIYLDPAGKDTASGLSASTPILTLDKAQQILKTMSADSNARIRNINIIIKEGNYYGQKVIWTYVNNGYTITFQARDTSKLPVFIGNPGNTDTWFYVNYIGSSKLSFRYIRVENYFVAMAFKGNHLESSRGNSDNKLFGMYFYNIGDKYTSPTDISQSSDAVIRLSNSKNNVIENSHFVNCGNRGLVSGVAPIHAIYIAHFSSGNQILRNAFSNITADPIRVRNGANNNTIDGNTFTDTGTRAFVSEWYCYNISDCSTGETANEARSTGNIFTDNTLIGKVVGNEIYGGYGGRAITQTFIIVPNIESDKSIIAYYNNKCGSDTSHLSSCPTQK